MPRVAQARNVNGDFKPHKSIVAQQRLAAARNTHACLRFAAVDVRFFEDLTISVALYSLIPYAQCHEQRQSYLVPF